MNVDPADLAPTQPSETAPAKWRGPIKHVYERVGKLNLGSANFAPGSGRDDPGLAETLDAGHDPEPRKPLRD